MLAGRVANSWHDTDFAFTMSVCAALRKRGEQVKSVIRAKLGQVDIPCAGSQDTFLPLSSICMYKRSIRKYVRV